MSTLHHGRSFQRFPLRKAKFSLTDLWPLGFPLWSGPVWPLQYKMYRPGVLKTIFCNLMKNVAVTKFLSKGIDCWRQPIHTLSWSHHLARQSHFLFLKSSQNVQIYNKINRTPFTSVRAICILVMWNIVTLDCKSNYCYRQPLFY